MNTNTRWASGLCAASFSALWRSGSQKKTRILIKYTNKSFLPPSLSLSLSLSLSVYFSSMIIKELNTLYWQKLDIFPLLLWRITFGSKLSNFRKYFENSNLFLVSLSFLVVELLLKFQIVIEEGEIPMTTCNDFELQSWSILVLFEILEPIELMSITI